MTTPSKAIRTVVDETYGFRRLEPIPVADELQGYYESAYYDPLRRAPEAEDKTETVARLTRAAEEEAEAERRWREAAGFADIAHYLTTLAPGRRVLDVGAGIGELVGYLNDNGFDASGIEPAEEASRYAQLHGRRIVRADLAAWGAQATEPSDAVVLLNVLEHVLDPEDTLRQVRALLAPGGVVCLRVPNDFSEIQRAVVDKLDCAPWWVVSPDHVSYFSRETLSALLAGAGFAVEVATCDFPIDWFLLMGENYLGDPDLGKACHERRKAFELALDPAQRRAIYEALGATGCGRNLLIYARRTD